MSPDGQGAAVSDQDVTTIHPTSRVEVQWLSRPRRIAPIATRGIPVRPATVWLAAQHVLSHVLGQPDYRRPSAADLAILLGTALVETPTVAATA
ncbi:MULTISPECIES: hypothetical protein [unclassified Streptomyces]|uniref:hypothetical protein n=1 Tax=unclassified Streptomyces TaxID=2593676 RepID=UPI00131A0BEC|nr:MULTISPECIES: hypothetical protein [unclassified Streptomyces]MYX39079.1 hypothetical protein [Streptomyces sp. SID8377]